MAKLKDSLRKEIIQIEKEIARIGLSTSLNTAFYPDLEFFQKSQIVDQMISSLRKNIEEGNSIKQELCEVAMFEKLNQNFEGGDKMVEKGLRSSKRIKGELGKAGRSNRKKLDEILGFIKNAFNYLQVEILGLKKIQNGLKIDKISKF